MYKFFEYDHLINEENFCNYEREKDLLRQYLANKDCLKIFGPRNFGKTSLIKNIIAPKWEAENPQQRMVIYADLYSVESLKDISQELTSAFNRTFSAKKSLMNKSMDWIKTLSKLRPVWSPSANTDSLGDFSIRTEQNESTVDFEVIFENINQLHAKNKIEFLIILDEFQEVAKIKRAEAKLRNSLQNLATKIPVVILGSKQHLLNQIFNQARAPFYAWGHTLEMGYIPFDQYHRYMNERFENTQKNIDENTAIYLQNKLNRIPESINRLCDFISRDPTIKNIEKNHVDLKMKEFIDYSRSMYEEHFASFKSNPKKVLLTLARLGKTSNLTGQKVLKEIPDLSKTGVSDIVKRFLNESIISRDLGDSGEFFYQVTDPFFCEFLKTYKILSANSFLS